MHVDKSIIGEAVVAMLDGHGHTCGLPCQIKGDNDLSLFQSPWIQRLQSSPIGRVKTRHMKGQRVYIHGAFNKSVPRQW